MTSESMGPNHTSQVHFRGTFNFVLPIHVRADGVEINGIADATSVRLAPSTSTKAPYDIICTVEFCLRPPRKVSEIFRKLEAGWDPEEKWSEFGFMGLEFLGPTSYRNFIDGARSFCSEIATRVLRTIRWRWSLHSSESVSYGPFEWSLNRDEWKHLPGVPAGVMESCVVHFCRFDSQQTEQLHQLLAHDRAEPLAHELLREADEFKHSHSRSSFVMSVTALESGLKDYIVAMQPETEWLLINLPSPPVERLLTELLPKLPACCTFDGRVLPPPKHLMETIKRAIRIRNDLVHKGYHGKHTVRLQATLDACHDVLYLLDYYRGNGWALNHMSERTRKELFSQ